MPNFTTPIPPKLSGETKADITALKRWGTALIDELTYIFNHLDSGNVIEAASVKAENIATENAKISNAQIGALTADKLVCGTVDTGNVKVADNNGTLSISGSEISISDRYQERFCASYNKSTGKFTFELYNDSGEPTVSINSDGNAVFKGLMESSEIFSSTIIGTDMDSYNGKGGGVFANIDKTGIKVMQDKNGTRYQKLGMAVANDGTAYMIFGSGNGSGKKIINGVEYTNGSFKIEKNESYANMGLVGYKPFITFWEDNGQLWLTGDKVMVNGYDILSEINTIKNQLSQLTTSEGE